MSGVFRLQSLVFETRYGYVKRQPRATDTVPVPCTIAETNLQYGMIAFPNSLPLTSIGSTGVLIFDEK